LIQRNSSAGSAIVFRLDGSPTQLQPEIPSALDKSAVAANESAVPSAAATFAQAGELAGIFPAKPRPERPRFEKSAVFAPVISGFGRRGRAAESGRPLRNPCLRITNAAQPA
jgi:hypothetical protein